VAIALTPDELNDRARLAAREHQRVKELEESKKEQVKEIAQEIKEAKKEHDRLTEIVQKGVELRLVDCVERLNITDKCVETVRVDNDEIVTTRPLTADENQLRMDEAFKGFEKSAKQYAEESAVTTFGATVISETAQDKPLALAAENPAHEADNDNAKPKRKKKSGAERIREKKAAVAAAPEPKSKKKPTKATKPKAEKPAKPTKPKAKKKPKPVLERHDFDEDEEVA
jgi:hypothetical protein